MKSCVMHFSKYESIILGSFIEKVVTFTLKNFICSTVGTLINNEIMTENLPMFPDLDAECSQLFAAASPT